jgi:hypothetical protein
VITLKVTTVRLDLHHPVSTLTTGSELWSFVSSMMYPKDRTKAWNYLSKYFKSIIRISTLSLQWLSRNWIEQYPIAYHSHQYHTQQPAQTPLPIIPMNVKSSLTIHETYIQLPLFETHTPGCRSRNEAPLAMWPHQEWRLLTTRTHHDTTKSDSIVQKQD